MPSKKLRLSRVTGSEASEVSSEDFKPSRMRFIFRFFRFDRFLFSSIFLFSYITSKTRTWNLLHVLLPLASQLFHKLGHRLNPSDV